MTFDIILILECKQLTVASKHELKSPIKTPLTHFKGVSSYGEVRVNVHLCQETYITEMNVCMMSSCVGGAIAELFNIMFRDQFIDLSFDRKFIDSFIFQAKITFIVFINDI